MSQETWVFKPKTEASYQGKHVGLNVSNGFVSFSCNVYAFENTVAKHFSEMYSEISKLNPNFSKWMKSLVPGKLLREMFGYSI